MVDPSDPGPKRPLVDTAIYEQLRQRATALLRRRGVTDLGSVSLVHEAMIRVMRAEQRGSLPNFDDEVEALKYLTRCLRNHLVNDAEGRGTEKRAGDRNRESLTESVALPATSRSQDEIEEIHRALAELAKDQPRIARIVELMFFGGCSQVEVGKILGVDARDVRTDWEVAREWLQRRLAAPRS